MRNWNLPCATNIFRERLTYPGPGPGAQARPRPARSRPQCRYESIFPLGRMKRGTNEPGENNGSPAEPQGRAKACPEAAPEEHTKMSPNAFTPMFSLHFEHFRLPSRSPSWLQILVPSAVIREYIFPRWPGIDLNRAQMVLKH